MRSSAIGGRRPPDIAPRDPRYERLYQVQKPYNEPPKFPRRPLFSLHRFKLTPLEGWSPLFLLAVALYSVIGSIIAAGWVTHAAILFIGPLLGLLAGLITAKVEHVPQAMLHIAACLAGYWLAVWLTCVPAFHIPLALLLASMRAALLGGIATSVLPANNVVFFFYLAFLCFFLAYFGCWLVYRAHLPWLVALVYSSIVLVNLNYAQSSSYYLIAVLTMALILLIARVQLVSQLAQWTREGLYTDQSWRRMMTLRCMQAASVVVLLTLLLSWLLPVQAQPASGKVIWNGINNSITNIANGHIAWQDPAALTQPYQPPSNYFSDQLTITGNIQLPPGEVLSYSSAAGPRYLEGATFNVFDGHTWTSSLTDADANAYAANESLPVDTVNASANAIKLRVTVLTPPGGTKNYLFAPAQPVLFDVASAVYSDGTAGAWVQQKPMTRGETYQVVSQEPLANKQVLSGVPLPHRNTAVWEQEGNYNQLVLHYTQAPARISPLVQQTTLNWTRNARDTYSALKDLETHLSDPSVFTYALDNPPVPGNVDVATWLLQTQRGYCTYYASTMVVMARLLGIPTRLVTGFSQGTFDKQHNVWSVQGSDAHSWVQAYLPAIGWVNFDPTPGYAPGAAPVQKSAAAPAPSPGARPTPVQKQPMQKVTPAAQQEQQARLHTTNASTSGGGNSALWPALAAIGLALLVLLLAAACVTHWWRNLYAQSSFAASRFWRLCRLASVFGLAPKQWQTPYEYGALLSRHFPQHSRSLWRLTEMFVRERWGAPYQMPRADEKRVIAQLWPSLQRMFLRLPWRQK